MDSSKDALQHVSFDGKPSGYRDFRRKTLLAIAGLEDKHAHLAGPRLLARLSGEAWRATEHLNIAELRTPTGFLTVIKALDEHYKFLPETELHESIDEFLFSLKRRNGEGATAFASRFRTQLARAETLISQEGELVRVKHRKTNGSQPPSVKEHDSDVEHTLSEASQSEQDGKTPEPAPASGASVAGSQSAKPADEAEPPDVGRHGDEGQSALGTARSQTSSRRRALGTRGGYEQDWAYAQKKMQQMLGTLEMGHVKPKPIFPQSVLGHLFMRKYGLSREQRAQVVRATNGSSRFSDIERILRASDFEEHRQDDRRSHNRPGRRDAMVVQQQHVMAVDSDSSSINVLDSGDSDGSEHAMAVDSNDTSDSDVQQELEEVYEIQKRAKEKFKKSFCSYIQGIEETCEGVETQSSTLLPSGCFESANRSGSIFWTGSDSSSFAKDFIQVRQEDSKQIELQNQAEGLTRFHQEGGSQHDRIYSGFFVCLHGGYNFN